MLLQGQEISKYDYVWNFGYGSPNTRFDYRDQNIIVESFQTELQVLKGSNNICNKEGDPLFYTNLCRIIDDNNNIIAGSEDLDFGYGYEDFCIDDDKGMVLFQNNLFIPNLHSDSSFYLIHNKPYLQSEPLDIFNIDLLLSEIKLSSEGEWSVDSINSIIIENDEIYSGFLAACKHANLKDWWVISAQQYSNRIFISLLTKDGIDSTKHQDIGITRTSSGDAGGQAAFSPSGEHFAQYSPGDGLSLFQFDNSVGHLSNFQFDTVDASGSFGGLAFSANSTRLYANTSRKIYQFDLTNNDFEGSKQIIGEYDGTLHNDFFPVGFGNMQLGPDCRIYIRSSATTPFMHVIMLPNELGIQCDFKQRGISMMSSYYKNIPTFPHFRYGEEEICNPDLALTVSTKDFSYNPLGKPFVTVFPNPSHVGSSVKIQTSIEKGFYSIYSLTGQRHFYGEASLDFDINLGENISPGVYILKIEDTQGNFISKKISLY